ncbi:dihydrofolate reductase [Parvibium lacunae]|uniref:Dihydrofolate reductase n=2 Tax=Parvibium lacunae TaxID=1888893 RepID=A0A368L5B0_9BURK|nr:dihydrofolate reductase [Parvibium lacunae]
MPYPNLSLIVATAKNRAIGINNTLPWHLPEDLRYFKTLTTGHTIIMGRKTYESIGKPLPNRRNIVISRQTSYAPEGVSVFHTLDVALAACAQEQEVFLIGGAMLYEQALPLTQRLYITEIDLDVAGDAFFPPIPPAFKEVWRETHVNSTTPPIRFSFTRWERLPAGVD